MAYNYKQIEQFINSVNEEAEKAAQAVYDKYEAELLRRVQSQLKEGDVVCCGMGAASIENPNTEREDIGESMCTVLSETQYWRGNVRAGFSLPFCFTKSGV